MDTGAYQGMRVDGPEFRNSGPGALPGTTLPLSFSLTLISYLLTKRSVVASFRRVIKKLAPIVCKDQVLMRTMRGVVIPSFSVPNAHVL